MKKSIYALLTCFALSTFAFQLDAQNELYVDGSGGASEVYVDGSNGTVPTLFVDGEIVVDGTNGLLQQQATGNQSLASITGDFTLSNDGRYTALDQSVFFFNGTGTQTVDFSGQATPNDRDFTVAHVNSPLVDLANGTEFSVSQTLFFRSSGTEASVIRTNNGHVLMQDGSSFDNHYMMPAAGLNVTTTQRYINGELRHDVNGTATSFDFPIGNGTSAQPAVATFSAAPDGGGNGFISGTFNSAQLNYANSTDICGVDVSVSSFDPYTGTWNIVPSDGSGNPASPTSDNEVGGGVTMDLDLRPHNVSTGPGVSHVILTDNGNPDYAGQPDDAAGDNILVQDVATNAAGPCVDAGAHLNPTSGSGNISNFGSFGAGLTLTQPLPVEMTPLTATARPNQDDILLSWTTLSENNNDKFILERSTDAQNFKVIDANIASKAPGGSSQTPIGYSQADKEVSFNQRYFYRLQQVDFDGSITFSNVAEAILTSDGQTTTQLTFFPNPTQNRLNLQVTTGEAKSMNLVFYDAIGKRIFNESFELSAGSNTFDLTQQLQDVAIGTYNAVIRIDGEVVTKKVIKND